MSGACGKTRASGGNVSGKMKPGVLFGVGLGPGDPELITLKAARLIGAAQVVAWPAAPGAESLARAIAAGLISPGVLELRVEVPMTAERAPAQAAYDAGAAEIGEVLAAGRDVVFLCEGDPLFYGSFMYLLSRLAGRFPVEVVPGVTSLSACAAQAGVPLAARNEQMAVLPAPLPEAELRRRIEASDSVAIMKLGRHLPKVRALLRDLGLEKRAIYVERATQAEEVICPLSEAPAMAPYFSLILLRKGDDPWL